MKGNLPENPFTPEEMAAMQEAIERAMRGEHDREAMARACRRMDEVREAVYRREGLLDFAVPVIRSLRDGDDDE